jgi:hypothetical protein
MFGKEPWTLISCSSEVRCCFDGAFGIGSGWENAGKCKEPKHIPQSFLEFPSYTSLIVLHRLDSGDTQLGCEIIDRFLMPCVVLGFSGTCLTREKRPVLTVITPLCFLIVSSIKS